MVKRGSRRRTSAAWARASAELAERIKSDSAMWAAIVKQTGFTPID
jgi:hypothetical protein